MTAGRAERRRSDAVRQGQAGAATGGAAALPALEEEARRERGEELLPQGAQLVSQLGSAACEAAIQLRAATELTTAGLGLSKARLTRVSSRPA